MSGSDTLFLRTTVHTFYVGQRHSVLEDDGTYFLCKAATLCSWGQRSILSMWGSDTLFLRTTVHTSYVGQRHSVCSWGKLYIFAMWGNTTICSWEKGSILAMWGSASLFVLETNDPYFLCEAAPLSLFLKKNDPFFFSHLGQLYSVYSWGTRSIFPMWGSAI